ncbi:MAG TPA: CHC2 zinc finger domain-containing protein [Polyangiaceae bacterium]|nr:CHC2 zinc finger domain-containing protein [Polyangiaceae bacterium]
MIPSLAARHDVYVGVLPRWRRSGGRDAVVGDCRTVWVDLDSDVAARVLEPVDPAPSLVVASGAPGHLHAYWSLRRAEPPLVIERANRRLAWALGADLASTDAARVLRPPATVNHVRGGAAVTFADAVAVGGVCDLSDLVGGLVDPPGRRADAPARQGGGSRRAGGDWLRDVPPERYVAALTGQRVGRSGKVRCPLHDDRIPSLHVYQQPEDGWYCFGCRSGGSIYDLAGALWGIEPRGDGMRGLRSALQHLLGPDVRRW